ncbi:LrgB family protein [Pokkaliibacter sp. CJK22405]|uniref:LrgB family protein n=1 Tax=Pokkaliibacter sp. CJK22405 TaxID=3384615 RepID=UPI0039852E19
MSSVSEVIKGVEQGNLIWLLMTLAAYSLGLWLNRKLGGSPWLHPVLLAMAMLITLLVVLGVPYKTYFSGAQLIHFLLGPATVALAVPLYDHLSKVREILGVLLMTCLAGAIVAALTAAGVALLLRADHQTVLSIMPKSVTSPIAMGVAETLGGIPSLTAGLVLITGAFGCMAGPLVFRWMKVEDPRVKGFVLGVTAHGFGTAHAFQYGAVAGAFGGLAIGMAGLFTAFFLPALAHLLGLT